MTDRTVDGRLERPGRIVDRIFRVGTVVGVSRSATVTAISVSTIVAIAFGFLLGSRVGTEGGAALDVPESTVEAGIDPVATLTVPPVFALDADTFLVFHDATLGGTRLDVGIVWVDVDATGTFRWIEGPAVVDGGRTSADGSGVGQLPTGLHVVVSYTVDGVAGSIYGTLAGTPTVDGGRVSYPVTVYDAPVDGARFDESNAYQSSGSYDIPTTLTDVRVMVVGQSLSTERP